MESTALQPSGGWWTRRSTGTKTLIIGTGIIIIITIAFIATRSKEEEPAKDKGEDIPDANTAAADTAVKPQPPTDSHPETMNNVPPQKPVAPPVDPTTLPNGGNGCGPLRTAYDGNYDYIKCQNVWFAKSKAKPSNPATRNKMPNWTNISGNKIAAQRLNSRYPKG